jgi:hypothetical protein
MFGSGGPRAGCAVRKLGLVCMSRLKRDMRGGAACARARLPPDGVRIRQAVACRFPATRTRAAENGGWLRPARTWPCVDNAKTPKRQTGSPMPAPHPQDGPPQARFHPRPGCRPALAGTRDRDFSGGWLGRSSRSGAPQGHPVQTDPAASGTRRCTASSVVLPHATTGTGRPSPRPARHVSGHPAAGVA